MTPESIYLRELAGRNAANYLELPTVKAVLLIGSAAEGVSDLCSDLDMAVYHDALPSEEALGQVRQRNGGDERLWVIGAREEGELVESYVVSGVECQFAHSTVEAWERDMSTVLEKLDTDSPLQKALSGLLSGVTLYGEELIAKWQAQAKDYPNALARAMVEANLGLFPIWGLQGKISTRDAAVWTYQSLVEGAQHILGILAGLNRKYYSTFQFKRMGSFVRELSICPEDLATRIDLLFTASPEDAAEKLEALVGETLDLVDLHMPSIDTSKPRKRIGWRQSPWTIS